MPVHVNWYIMDLGQGILHHAHLFPNNKDVTRSYQKRNLTVTANIFIHEIEMACVATLHLLKAGS